MGLKARQPTNTNEALREAFVITEREAAERFDTRAKLESKGNFGCHVLVLESSLPDMADRKYWMNDEHFRFLWDKYSPTQDIGTVVVVGDVFVKNANISDRLMSIIVTGDLSAGRLSIFDTEFTVYGSASVESLLDHDGLLKVHGEQHIKETRGLGDDADDNRPM